MLLKLINIRPFLPHIIIFSVFLLFFGCAAYQYEPEPIVTEQSQKNYESRTLVDQELKKFLSEHGISIKAWPLDKWNLQSLAFAAYYYHPDLQLAISEFEKSQIINKYITQYPNPRIQLPLEHHSDTTGNVTPWTAGIIFDFIIEREAKREAKQELSTSESGLAMIKVNGAAWNIYTNLRQRYIEYFISLKKLDEIGQQIAVAEEIISILTKRKEYAQASDFEISSARLELQRLKLEQINQQVQVTESHHSIADAIGIPPEAINNLEIDFSDLEKLQAMNIQDESEYRSMALQHRSEIQQAISKYAVYEAKLRLEIEKQYPDINLSPGFIFDQEDKIWTLGTSWLISLLHPENEGPIQEALAERETRRVEFLARQASIINEVSTDYSRSVALKQARELSGQIYDEAKERYQQMQKQYDLGYIDNLELTRSKNEVLNMQQALFEIEASYLKSCGLLEDAIGQPFLGNRTIEFNLQDLGMDNESL